MNNKTLRDLKEGDRFRFPGDPETRVRTLSQKGKVEGYCPYDGQNTMGHSKEGGEEVYLLGTKVVPIGNKEYANNKTLAAKFGNELKCTGGDWKASLMCGVVTTIGMTDIILPDTEEDKALMAASKDLYEALRALSLISSHSSESHIFSKELKAAEVALRKANPDYKP